MRTSTIIEKLSESEVGAVLPEEYKFFSGTRIRLWSLSSNFQSKRDLKELGEVFPSFKIHDPLLILREGYSSLRAANNAVARAREITTHPVIRQFFLIPTKRVSPSKPKQFGIVRQSRRKVVVV